jgi:hypothetical protein
MQRFALKLKLQTLPTIALKAIWSRVSDEDGHISHCVCVFVVLRIAIRVDDEEPCAL